MPLHRAYILICFVAAFLLWSPRSASAVSTLVSGSASLKYTDYELNEGGIRGYVGDTFYQKYSLRGMGGGNLYNRSGGPYNFTLSYDHLRFLSHINGTDSSSSLSAFGWDGTLRLDMPHLYGLKFNMAASKVKSAAIGLSAPSYGDLNPGLVDDLSSSNGKNNSYSLTLGTNGGPYYYLYHSSTHSVGLSGSRQDSSRSGLSMQYGVNWLHLYRTKEDSFGQRVFRIGNVSADGGRRYWYRLTNWLDVSADFQYVESDANQGDSSRNAMTLAFNGSDGQTDIGGYMVYVRGDSDSETSKSLSLPFWVGHKLSPVNTLSLYNSYSNTETRKLATPGVSRSTNLRESLVLNSRPSRDFYLDTGYSFGKRDLDGAGSESHSVSINGYKRGVDGFFYTFSYRYDRAIAIDKVDDAAAGTTYSGLSADSHTINASVTYSPTTQTRLYLKQAYLAAYALGREPSERYERFVTTFNLKHNFLSGWDSRLDIVRDMLLYEDGPERITDKMHIDISNNINSRMEVDIDLDFTKGQSESDGIHKDSTSSAARTSILYRLKRNLTSRTGLNTSQSKSSEAASQSTIGLSEGLTYSYYRKGFTKRKLYDLSASVYYFKREAGNSQEEKDSLNMAVSYYPTSNFSCGASYSTEAGDAQEITKKTLYFALKYTLLSLNGSYVQRLRDEVDREENLYKLDLNKKF